MSSFKACDKSTSLGMFYAKLNKVCMQLIIAGFFYCSTQKYNLSKLKWSCIEVCIKSYVSVKKNAKTRVLPFKYSEFKVEIITFLYFLSVFFIFGILQLFEIAWFSHIFYNALKYSTFVCFTLKLKCIVVGFYVTDQLCPKSVSPQTQVICMFWECPLYDKLITFWGGISAIWTSSVWPGTHIKTENWSWRPLW